MSRRMRGWSAGRRPGSGLRIEQVSAVNLPLADADATAAEWVHLLEQASNATSLDDAAGLAADAGYTLTIIAEPATASVAATLTASGRTYGTFYGHTWSDVAMKIADWLDPDGEAAQ